MPVTLAAMTSTRFPAHRSLAHAAAAVSALSASPAAARACAFVEVKKAKQPLI
jgi:hypothetical protein